MDGLERCGCHYILGRKYLMSTNNSYRPIRFRNDCFGGSKKDILIYSPITSLKYTFLNDCVVYETSYNVFCKNPHCGNLIFSRDEFRHITQLYLYSSNFFQDLLYYLNSVLADSKIVNPAGATG